MELLTRTLEQIQPLNAEVMELTQAKLDVLTKPLGSLGVLEQMARQVAGITGVVVPKVGKKRVIVMAGDHGVVEEGVSAFPPETTVGMVQNFVDGGAGVNVLSRHVGAEVQVVDVGVKTEVNYPGVVQAKVKPGTDNMAKGPAMSRSEAIAAVEVGIREAETAIKAGVTMLATGEVGIGNTTPSSAIVVVLGGHPVELVTGRGTGISDRSLQNKQQVILRAIELNQPNPEDPLDVLAKVGGLDIAGMAGVILGAAANRVPVVVDGFISSAAALIAAKLAPISKEYMIGSHGSMEPGHRLAMETLGIKPMLYMEMRLGEGTGAALGMGMVDAALKILGEMATFEGAGIADRIVD